MQVFFGSYTIFRYEGRKNHHTTAHKMLTCWGNADDAREPKVHLLTVDSSASAASRSPAAPPYNNNNNNNRRRNYSTTTNTNDNATSMHTVTPLAPTATTTVGTDSKLLTVGSWNIRSLSKSRDDAELQRIV